MEVWGSFPEEDKMECLESLHDEVIQIQSASEFINSSSSQHKNRGIESMLCSNALLINILGSGESGCGTILGWLCFL